MMTPPPEPDVLTPRIPRPVGYPIIAPSVALVVIGCVMVALGVVGSMLTGTSLGSLLATPGLFLAGAGVLLPFFYDTIRGRSLATERAWFALTLADLLEMGVPMDTAVERMADEGRGRLVTRYGRMTQALQRIAEDLPEGSSLGRAMAATAVFPPSWPILVRRGEVVEDLPSVLRRLGASSSEAAWLAPHVWMRQLVLVGGLILVGLFVQTYILPTFISLYEGMGMDVPLSTKLFIAVSRSVRYPIVGAAALLLAFAVAAALIAVPAVRQWLLRITLPGAAEVDQARAAHAMATGLEMGLSTSEAFDAAAWSVSAPKYRRALQDLARDPGADAASGLARYPALFAPPLRWLASQGERLGDLPDALRAASAFLEESADLSRRRAVVWLDTALLLLAGAACALFALAMMQPLVGLTTGMLEKAVLP